MYGGVSLGGMHMTGGARSKFPSLDKEIISQYLDPNADSYELSDPAAQNMSEAVLDRYIKGVVEKYEAKQNKVKAPRAPRARAPRAPKPPKAPRVRVPRVRAPLTPAQKAQRNAKERERRQQKKFELIQRLQSGHATLADKNLLLGTRIFGKAERKGLFNDEHNKKMTQQDKVDLSNWLANHWEFENPPRGYGAGMYSDSDNDELMAGGAMIKHSMPRGKKMHRALSHNPVRRRHAPKRGRKPRGAGIGTTIGSIADALFGFGEGDEMELLAGGARRGRGRPMRHSVMRHEGNMASALRNEIDHGHPRVVGNHRMYQDGTPVGGARRGRGRPRKHHGGVEMGGVEMGGARRGRGRPRKHARGGFDWGKLAETALPLALSFL